jgi:mannose-6-phosphate isomerase-like protein (cupin superfamily)
VRAGGSDLTTSIRSPRLNRREQTQIGPLLSETRPWGIWEEYLNEQTYRVKRLIVDPGKRISLQKHKQRSECWVVVQGEGMVTLNQEQRNVSTGDTVFIPKEAVHRLENKGSAPLIVIETQFGVCLEEDVIRLADDWGRT